MERQAEAVVEGPEDLMWSLDLILQHRDAKWYSLFGKQLGSYL